MAEFAFDVVVSTERTEGINVSNDLIEQDLRSALDEANPQSLDVEDSVYDVTDWTVEAQEGKRKSAQPRGYDADQLLIALDNVFEQFHAAHPINLDGPQAWDGYDESIVRLMSMQGLGEAITKARQRQYEKQKRDEQKARMQERRKR